LGRDLRAGVTLTTQNLDRITGGLRSLAWRGKRSRRAVAQALDTLSAKALDPLGDRFRRGVIAARSFGLTQPSIHHGAHHCLSTFWGQAGILVGVHSVLRESLRFGNISVPGQDRMDNLLKVHI